MSHASFHAVSVKSGRDGAGALSAALAATTRALYQQINQAHHNLAGFRLTAVSHTHSLNVAEDATNHAVVTAIASYEYT